MERLNDKKNPSEVPLFVFCVKLGRVTYPCCLTANFYALALFTYMRNFESNHIAFYPLKKKKTSLI